MVERWNDYASDNIADTGFPYWDDVAISLGRAIAKGEWSITIEPPDPDPTETARWLGPFRSYFPMIQVQAPDPI